MKLEGFGGVKFWMRRTAEEHNKIAVQNINKSGDLFFQAMNIDKMQEEVQKQVIGNLLEDIKLLWGEEELQRIKKEYFE